MPTHMDKKFSVLYKLLWQDSPSPIVVMLKLAYANLKENIAQAKAEVWITDKEPTYLQNRVIWCANCNVKRALTKRQGTSLIVCNVCNGTNWEHFTNKYFVTQSVTVTNTVTGEVKELMP